MRLSRWIAALAAIALFCVPTKGQQLIFPVAGVVTVDASPGKAPYEVFVNAVVTSVVFTNPTPGQLLTVLFLQDSTGHAVTFGGNILNACTVATTASALTSCQFQYDARTVQWTGAGGGGSGGGITQVSSIPATCTFGTSQPLSLTVIPGSIYYCQPNGTYQNTSYTPAVFDPTNPIWAGGAQPGRYIQDATFANGSNIIDCTFSNDCNFAAGMNGQVCYGTNINGDTSALTSVVVLPEGTLTVTDAQHATCSGGNATASTTHNGTFVWGPLSTATAAQTQSTANDPLFALWTAVLAACAQGSPVVVRWPAGPLLIERSVFNTGTTTTCTAATPSGWAGITLRGAGGVASQFMPTPSFRAADCVGGPASDLNGCLFSAGGFFFQDFGIFGAGQSAIGAGFNGKVGIIVHGTSQSNSYVTNLNLLSWGTATTGFAGIKFENMSDTVETRMINDGFGSNPNCWVKLPVSGLTTFEGVNCSVAATTNLLVDGTAGVSSFTSHGGTYGFTSGSSGTPPIVTTNAAGSVAQFDGDVNPYQTGAGQSLISAQGAGLTVLNGVTFINSGAGKFGVGTFSGGNINIRDSIITCTGCTAIAVGNGGKIQMNGGSVVTGTVALQTIVGGTLYQNGMDKYTGTVTNSGTIIGAQNSATATACTTGNFALTSGWGTSSIASVTAGGNILGCHVSVTGAAGSAGPVLTWTYPAAPLIAPASCHLIGTTASLPTVSVGTPGATNVAFTFTRTPVAVTYTFDVGCP